MGLVFLSLLIFLVVLFLNWGITLNRFHQMSILLPINHDSDNGHLRTVWERVGQLLSSVNVFIDGANFYNQLTITERDNLIHSGWTYLETKAEAGKKAPLVKTCCEAWLTLLPRPVTVDGRNPLLQAVCYSLHSHTDAIHIHIWTSGHMFTHIHTTYTHST